MIPRVLNAATVGLVTAGPVYAGVKLSVWGSPVKPLLFLVVTVSTYAAASKVSGRSRLVAVLVTHPVSRTLTPALVSWIRYALCVATVQDTVISALVGLALGLVIVGLSLADGCT